MKLVLITTTNRLAGRQRELDRLLDSIAQAEPSVGRNIHVVLVLQNSHALDADKDKLRHLTVIPVAGQLALSKARNLALRHVFDERLHEDAIVGFPDDDCWYVPGFLEALTDYLRDHRRVSFWFCRYGSAPALIALGNSKPARIADVVRRSASSTVFIRGSAVREIGFFDERFGLGTPNVAGEDTDYMLRISAADYTGTFLDAPLIGHKDRDPARTAVHFVSTARVLRKYSPCSGALKYEYYRKLVVGLYLAARGRLTYDSLREGLRH